MCAPGQALDPKAKTQKPHSANFGTAQRKQPMAIYHMTVKMIGRSSGRSSVAAAAYRADEKIKNEWDGVTHDYIGYHSAKGIDVAYSAIILPESAPKDFADRSVLWNAVEKSEKRKDAQTAREVEVALPKELPLNELINELIEYINKNFVSQGMIADVSIHNNIGNPHAHIMLTTRTVGPEGFGAKNRGWNEKSLLVEWRESWAQMCNIRLSEKEIPPIDHRTLEAQGIDRVPTIHMGKYALMEKRGRHTRRGDRNRAAVELNTLRAEDRQDKQELYQMYAANPDALKEAIRTRRDELAIVKCKAWDVEPLRAIYGKHELAAVFAKNKDGDIHCIHEESDRDAVMAATKELEALRADVNNNIRITTEGGHTTVKDIPSGKEIYISAATSKHTAVSGMVQEVFGYDKVKADLAANKYGSTLPKELQAAYIEHPQKRKAPDIEAPQAQEEQPKQNQTYTIARQPGGTFKVTLGATVKEYTLKDKAETIKQMAKDFGMSSETAEQIYDKTDNQKTYKQPENGQQKMFSMEELRRRKEIIAQTEKEKGRGGDGSHGAR
jgi:hypothetical protein